MTRSGTPSNCRQWLQGRWSRALLLITLVTAALGPLAAAAHLAREEGGLFVSVRPVLSRCVTCHSGKAPQGGLNLTRREAALRGGKSGAAVRPGRARESPLYRMAAAGKMPPGQPLAQREVEALRRWIDAGAEWPAGETLAGGEPPRAGLDWWSLRPLTRPSVPTVPKVWTYGRVDVRTYGGRGVSSPRPHVRTSTLPSSPGLWVRNPVDAFVLSRLLRAGLAPAPEADRATLIRRATFDLLGLPPTPEEMAAFVGDRAPDSWEKVIDRLLASPHYGERWGRHWLDVVRFAESQGFERDKIRDHAWRYRDYVVSSLNADKPYDRFVREQIAGDVGEPFSSEGVVATGFLVAGPWDEVGNTVSPSTLLKARVREEELEDTIGAVGQTFLGMTVNCARCHDHKFDPIPQTDYYRFKAALDGVLHGDRPLAPPAEAKASAERVAPVRARIARLEKEIAALETAGREAARRQRMVTAPEMAADVKPEEAVRALSEEQRRQRKTLVGELARERETLRAVPPLPMAYAANPRQPERTFVLIRGDVENPGTPVTAGALSALRSPPSDFGLPADSPEGQRRRALAEWITSPHNPLTARVIVNRVWQYHFGRGIVPTANDFGFNGERPSHQELLDYLAWCFARRSVDVRTYGRVEVLKGTNPPSTRPNVHTSTRSAARPWSLKSLHRLIMLSSTYRQSGRFDAGAAARDGENRLLWRFPPRRLEGEEVRDAILAASGQLNPAVGGPSFQPFRVVVDNSNFYTLTDAEGPEFNRRSIYRMLVNSARDPLLETFDCPDPSTKTPQRAVTTTPLQALTMMNSAFVLRQARHFAERVSGESGEPGAAGQAIAGPGQGAEARINGRVAAIRRAYQIAVGRQPTVAELGRAATLAAEHGMESLCWVLLNSSEFLYVR